MEDRGDYDADAERHIAIAVIKPDRSRVLQTVVDGVNLLADAIGAENPAAGIAVKTVAVLGGWVFQIHKYDRVRPALQAVAERLERTRTEYVRKEEFADVLEDALRRLAEQPNAERRQRIQNLLTNVMARPRDHAEHRLFLRLADELPPDPLKYLFAHGGLNAGERQPTIRGLARIAGVPTGETDRVLAFLIGEHLFERIPDFGLGRSSP